MLFLNIDVAEYVPGTVVQVDYAAPFVYVAPRFNCIFDIACHFAQIEDIGQPSTQDGTFDPVSIASFKNGAVVEYQCGPGATFDAGGGNYEDVQTFVCAVDGSWNLDPVALKPCLRK